MGRQRRKPMTDARRLARRMYNMRPEVRARKAIRRALRHHRTPPPINFTAVPPVGKFK